MLTTNTVTFASRVFSTGMVAILIFLGSLLLGFGGVYAVHGAASYLVSCTWDSVFLVLLPALVVASAASVTFLAHPVHSLLALIFVFFGTALAYLYVGAEFLAFIFLIVYVGAIAILFLFVIMLLNIKELTARGVFGKSFITAAGTVGVLVVAQLLSTTISTFAGVAVDRLPSGLVTSNAVADFAIYQFSDVLLFSTLLYTHYSVLFVLIALLLLTAMLGAIVLATSATD